MAITKKTKTKTKSWYVAQLDRVFSLYIRKIYSNDFGMVMCYTCSKVGEAKEMQCGHFISRSHMSTRWDEQNCRVQCVGCNIFKSGNYVEFSYRLLKEIGEKALDALMAKKQEIRQWSIPELQEKIKYYKSQL